ncbi:transposase [Pseudonocardia alaniniphila]|uniref:transposase n=1 Tax=Pseudonocardia alaniniphila TaxID=75291 RepID=UPI00364356AD
MRMVLGLRAQDPEDRGVLSRVVKQLGVNPEALRHYVRQAEVDAGLRTGVPSGEAARIKELEREVGELRRANDILVQHRRLLARDRGLAAGHPPAH